jgi:hypothetical protein
MQNLRIAPSIEDETRDPGPFVGELPLDGRAPPGSRGVTAALRRHFTARLAPMSGG